MPKYFSKDVLPWQNKAFLSAKILYRGTTCHFSDVITVLEDSIFPKHSTKKVLPWQQQGIHSQTFTFKRIPVYFQEKSPNLVELSFSLPGLWAKLLKGDAKHSSGQDRVKNKQVKCGVKLEALKCKF